MTLNIQSVLTEAARHMPRKRGSGAGWLRREGGRWMGRWRAYDKGEPRVRQWAVEPEGMTEKEAAKLTKKDAAKFLAKHIQDNRPGSGMSFGAAAEMYYDLRKQHWGKNHWQAVRSILDRQIIPALGKMKVSEIRPSQVQAFLNSIGLDQSKSMLKKCRIHVGSILEMLVEDEILNRNPARSKGLRMPKTKAETKLTLSMEECRALLGVAMLTNNRDYLILRLMFGCALRPSEVFGLRGNDIGYRRIKIDEVAVPDEKPRMETKSEASEAWLPISPDLDSLLRAYAKDIPDEAFLFANRYGAPLSHNSWLKKHLKPLAKKCGIKHIDQRMIRRTVSTLAQKPTPDSTIKDMQSLMRHADAQTTLGIYQQEIPEGTRRLAEAWDAMLIKSAEDK